MPGREGAPKDADEPYLPSATFILMAARGDIPLDGNAMASDNLKRLIAYTCDADLANRDWATMALAMRAPDTEDVRAALLQACKDPDAAVRGEALVGLAERDKHLAVAEVQRELRGDDCTPPTFQAAEIVADPCLVDGLRSWLGRFDEGWIEEAISAAIAACKRSTASRS